MWSLRFTSVNFFYLSSSPDLQTIYIAPGKCSEWKKKKKRITFKLMTKKTNNRWHDLRVIYKVPFRFNGVRKRRERERQRERNINIKKKKTFFFLGKKRAALYFSGNHSFSLKHPRAHTASFLVLLISNTSVKCSSYIYLYIMKRT